MNRANTKGFTLIELLVVIGIVAILSAVVILTLNPAELLRQSRDSNRLSDMSTLKSAIALYLADVNTPRIHDASSTTSIPCSTSVPSSTLPVATNPLNTITCGARFITSTGTSTKSGILAVDASGWIPVRFIDISAGAPVGNLPKDPVNDNTYFYAYAAVSTTLVFEVNTDMESSRYRSGGSSNVEGPDGGTDANIYEVGTAPGLAL